jgi:hypothetical protein
MEYLSLITIIIHKFLTFQGLDDDFPLDQRNLSVARELF